MTKPGIRASDSYSGNNAQGLIEFVIRDRQGRIIDTFVEPNLIKVFAKEIFANRIGHSEVWDPSASSGTGAWVSSGLDPNEDFSVKYVLFGASFDGDGIPLDTNDSRFYTTDPVTQLPVPIRLTPGADFGGGLINPVPISEPERPLKRIENIDFENSYQPAGNPLMTADTRAMNNIVLFETTLEVDEYNGLGTTGSDFFTITEVALAGGKKLDSVGACDCDPHEAFLEGSTNGDAFIGTFSGGNVVTLDASESDADISKIVEGDQVKLVDVGDTAGDPVSLDQVSDYYLLTAKSATGREITLDRVPVDSNNVPLTGQVGVFRDTLRIFSHRILRTPVKKSADLEILVRWRIILS
jgi:hypothetical protein